MKRNLAVVAVIMIVGTVLLVLFAVHDRPKPIKQAEVKPSPIESQDKKQAQDFCIFAESATAATTSHVSGFQETTGDTRFQEIMERIHALRDMGEWETEIINDGIAEDTELVALQNSEVNDILRRHIRAKQKLIAKINKTRNKYWPQ